MQITSNRPDDQLIPILDKEDKKEIFISIHTLPTDIWKIIFNNLNFDAWKNLIFTNKTFKRICEDPSISNSLLERVKCIPDTNKVPFAIKLGSHLIKFQWRDVSLHELKNILVTCTNLEEFRLNWNSFLLEPKPVNQRFLTPLCQTLSSVFATFSKKKENALRDQQMALTTQKCDKLTKLTFVQFPFSQQQLIEILNACPQLIKLSLESCRLTNKILSHLPTNLQKLNLSSCHDMTDENLVPLKSLIHLTHLNLNFCEKITDNGLKHLKMLSSLNKLSLIECDQITQEGCECLKPLVPKRFLSLNLSNLNLESLKNIPAFISTLSLKRENNQ